MIFYLPVNNPTINVMRPPSNNNKQNIIKLTIPSGPLNALNKGVKKG